jgi:hypothetical protein
MVPEKKVLVESLHPKQPRRYVVRLFFIVKQRPSSMFDFKLWKSYNTHAQRLKLLVEIMSYFVRVPSDGLMIRRMTIQKCKRPLSARNP